MLSGYSPVPPLPPVAVALPGMIDPSLPEMFPWQRETFQRKFDELTLFGAMSEERAREQALSYALAAEPVEISPETFATWPEVSRWPP
jgi:hypothetical protein